MKIIHLILILIYLKTTQSSLYANIKDSIQLFLKRARDISPENQEYDINIEKQDNLRHNRILQFSNDEKEDTKRAHEKAKILLQARTKKHRLNNGRDMKPFKGAGDPKIGKTYYHMDPVLNQMRRSGKKRRKASSSDMSQSSSSLEMNDWKDDFNVMWLEKKFQALNGSNQNSYGDQVAMVAARPWGVTCGDPNQHDTPWGTCMLSAECDGEYRIYRGDYICGRSMYVCCALKHTNYDLYQGFDVSFEDSSFETDSEEKKAKEKGKYSKENRKKKYGKEKKSRQLDRKKRKRVIKKKIQKIVREIRKILNRSYKNASRNRKKRTSVLKKYIKLLKKQYKMDRKSVRDVHERDIIQIDKNLEQRLKEVMSVNKGFMLNSTFRDIIMKGTIDKAGARMLLQAYPDMIDVLQSRLRRASGGEADSKEPDKPPDDYLGYDIEYGALYY